MARLGRGRLAAFLCFIALVVVVLCLSVSLPVESYLERGHSWVKRQGFAGGVVCFAIFTLWIIVCIPATPFQLFLGFTFGFGYGFLIGFVSSIAGASCSFAIGRCSGADAVRLGMDRCKCRRGLKLLSAVDQAVKDQGWRIILLMQFAYIPTGVKNYGCTLLSITFCEFLWTKAVSSVCLTPLAVYTGSSAHDFLAVYSSHANMSPAKIVVLVLGLLCLLAVVLLIGMYVRRAMRQADLQDYEALDTASTSASLARELIAVDSPPAARDEGDSCAILQQQQQQQQQPREQVQKQRQQQKSSSEAGASADAAQYDNG